MSYKEKREYKSNSFSLLMKEKKYALQVYNSLNGTSYMDEGLIEIVEIQGGVALSIQGDSLFLVDNYVNLYEHQSSVNVNMPLRFDIYIAQYYKYYVKENKFNLYGKSPITIPEPKLVVFYNGIEDYPSVTILRLSDSFINKGDSPHDLEVQCHVYNINPGKNKMIEDSCPAIKGYTTYVEKVRKYSIEFDLADAITKAIDECINEGVLVDFFKENKEMIISDDVIDCTFEARLELTRLEVERKYSVIIAQKDGIITEKNEIITEKDEIITEKDGIITEKDEIITEKDELLKKYKDKYGDL